MNKDDPRLGKIKDSTDLLKDCRMRLNILLSFCMILTSALMLISSTYHQTTSIMPSDLIRHKPHMLVMDSHHKERERTLFYTSLWFAFPRARVTNPNKTVKTVYLSMLQEHTLSLISLCTNTKA